MSAKSNNNVNATAADETLKALAGFASSLSQFMPASEAINEERVAEIVDAKIAVAKLPRPFVVVLPDGKQNKVEGAHQQFEELMGIISEGHKNVLMVGPAGSGKTTLAKSVADGLGIPFKFISLSSGVTETHILGRTLPQSDGSWKFVASPFVEVYENGGVFLLDELDAADANVMVAINAALANGVLVTPDGLIRKRHDSCYIIGAANTWGRGGDHQYVGRNQLDAATLDRFVMSTTYVEYDSNLEESIAAALDSEVASSLLDWVRDLRQKIATYRLRRVASTRLIVGSVQALKAGRTLEEVKGRYFRSWSADERAKVA